MWEQLSPTARARVDGFRGKRIGVVGLGREGVDLARFLAAAGAEIVASDSAPPDALSGARASLEAAPVSFKLGAQQPDDLLECDEVFVSPGVPRTVPVIANAAEHGIPLESATRLFLELAPGPILGITGSSGKTTTTTLIGEILKAEGLPTFVGGNMGTPTLAHLEHLTRDTWSVLELSSFQLDDVTESPTLGVVLNITPNHLDRHPDMDDYIRAKGNLIRHQHEDDVAVLNADDPIVRALVHPSHTAAFSLSGPVNGAWLAGDELRIGGSIWNQRSHSLVPVPEQTLLPRADIPLRGIHNVANTLAAAAAALCVGCRVESITAAVRGFRPVDHRLEVVAEIDGVTFVNDSIATSPERSIAALKSFEEPVVLIAGGRDKHLPMDDWAALIQQRTRAVVLVGEATDIIEAALQRAGGRASVIHALSFAEVVNLAKEAAHPGDIVLLSPGCTSFDEFRDYEARGEAFRAAVGALENKGESHAR
jgi:UDP-N-acetylmuramoylalanine--D-glutamate ligase